MPASRRAGATLALLALVSFPAGAQAPAEPPVEAQAPPAADPLGEPPSDTPTAPVDARMVEVSLGDWGVKNEIARILSIGVAEVPLTVVVDTDLAAEVCPIGRDDLSEQSVVAATRTCAAKTFVPALADRAREQARPPAD